MNIKNNKGMVILIISYGIVAVLLILGVAFFSRSFSEHRVAQRQKDDIKALAIAEAGLDRMLYKLRLDFQYSEQYSESWTDGWIDGVPWTPDPNNFVEVIPWTDFGTGQSRGQYRVEMQSVSGSELWVRSIARFYDSITEETFSDTTKSIQAYVRAKNINIWNNAIFAGAGSAGAAINGNVDIRGSVHILGTGLNDTDLAISTSGTAQVGNNYENMPAALLNRIPSCPTRSFNGETVEFLDASVRIKNGLASLSGTGTFGAGDQTGNPYKETVEGAYVTDGYAGNQGINNVYSDNGTWNRYDLGDAVSFPSLGSGPGSHLQYLEDNALVITDPAQLTQLADIRPDSVFEYVDIKDPANPDDDCRIRMDGNGNLEIDGIVYINGNLGMLSRGGQNTINYTGKGSILAEGEVNMEVNLYSSGNNSFPTQNVIGIMTPNDINFGTSQKDVMGAFYAEGIVTAAFQTDVAGTFVTNYFNMGNQVPSVYQVPALADNLPPGMISSEPIWIVETVAWQEL